MGTKASIVQERQTGCTIAHVWTSIGAAVSAGKPWSASTSRAVKTRHDLRYDVFLLRLAGMIRLLEAVPDLRDRS
jgi:hypothetical protein